MATRKKSGKAKKSTGAKTKTTGKKTSRTARKASQRGTQTRKTPAKSGGESNFTLALKLFRKDKFDKAWQQCRSLVDDSELLKTTNCDLILFAAWLATRSGNHTAAHDLLDAARVGGAEGISYHFVATLISQNFNEPDEALRHAGKALSLVALGADLNSKWLDRKRTLAEIYFTTGQANSSCGKLDAAAEAYERAIEHDHINEEAYLRLALTRKAQGRLSEARAVVEQGTRNCKKHTELAKIKSLLPEHESISLCMIVKDEQEMLGQCLDSVKDLVDEVIIVDTGSTDKTVEIAESYGAKVYHHPWEKNFSKHRNQSLGYATGDWILILDADEELIRADHDRLRQAISQDNYGAVSVSIHNKHMRTGEITSFLPSIRLWRSGLGAKYEGIVHNELRLPEDVKILRADIRIIHYGYGLDWGKMKEKIKRSKELLYKQLEENPDNAFANFNLAQLIRGEHKTPPPEACRELLEHAGRAVENTSPTAKGQRHIHLMALDQMSSAHFFLKEYDEAEEIALKALEHEPNYLDPMFMLGNIYAGARKMEDAIAAFERYIEAADNYEPGEETTSFIMQHTFSQPRACFNLGLIYEEIGRNEEAIATFERVFNYRESFQDVLTHLSLASLRLGNFAESERYGRRRLKEKKDDRNARQLVARACYRQRKLQQARNLCRELLDFESTDTIAMELLIAIERADGDDQAAMNWIEQLLELDKDNITGLREKADIFACRNEPDKALAVYQKLYRIGPRDAAIINDLANCYFRLDEFKDALHFYSEALSLEPQLTPALRNLGLTYFKLGDSGKAIAKLANYLDYIQDDSDILYLVARLHFDRGNFAEAARYVERCLQLNPNSAELVALLADCYLKQGHVKSARLGYQKALAIDPGFSPAADMLELIDDAEQEQQETEQIKEPSGG